MLTHKKYLPAGFAIILMITVGLFLFMPGSVRAGQASAPLSITIDELRSLMENPATVILDVRQTGDWKNSVNKIKGAVRQDPRHFETWVSHYAHSSTIVLYCA